MANHNTRFSAVLVLDSAEQETKALALKNGDEDYFDVEAVAGREGEGKFGLWIFADEDGSPDDVIAYVIKIGREFKLKGKCGFAWSSACDRPRVGEFGGGAAVIDLSTGKPTFINTDAWLQEHGV